MIKRRNSYSCFSKPWKRSSYSMQIPGNLFMDAPPHVDLQDLVNQSYDKTYWKSLESSIPSHLRGVTIYTE